MRTRDQLLQALNTENGNYIRGETNPYPVPLEPLLEVLLDIRDLLARDNIDPEKSLLRKP